MTTPWPTDACYLQLDDLIVDLRFRRLICPEQSGEIPQRVFDLFLLFLSEPHKLHSRSGLFERLWSGTIVEDTNLSQNVWLLRKALGETRKNWIRTVAKSGYVFEPPGPLRWFQQLPPTASAAGDIAAADGSALAPAEAVLVPAAVLESVDSVAVPTVLTHVQSAVDPIVAQESAPLAASSPPPIGPIGRRYRWAAGAAALALICVVVALFVGQPWRADRNGQAVAIVATQEQHNSSTWATTLLEQWLSWKLESLPEVNLITQSDLAAGGGPMSVNVVFLSSERMPDAPERIAVYARVLRNGKEARFEAKGDLSEAPALIDSVSRQVVAELVPRHERPWPTLELSASAAERYAQAAAARRRRDWMAVAKIGAEVVEMAPRFGLMRLQLAQAQAQLYNSAAANEQMQAAVRLLAPVPAGVGAQLQAQRLAVDPLSEINALNAYSSLIELYPDKAAYRLEQVRLLLAVGRPKDAQMRLAAMWSAREPVSVRVSKDQYRADAYRMMGDAGRSRALATAAEKMLQDLGPGWTLERADAMVNIAMADIEQHPERGTSPWFGRAADLYDQAGNTTRALYSRFLAQMTKRPGPDGDAGMDELLARARAGGYRRLEFMALMASAMRASGTGDITSSRTRLQQAYAVAEALGDVHSMRQISVILLGGQIQSARFAEVDASIAQLRDANLQTGAGFLYGQQVAKLAFIRGRYQDALLALDNAEKLRTTIAEQQVDTGMRASLSCSRADILISLGRLPEARQSLARCAKANYRFSGPAAILGESYLELVAGDRQRSAALLEKADKSPVMGAPSKWTQQIGIAAIAVRLGDTDRADRIYAKLLPELRSTGYVMQIAAVYVGQVESAATRGDWPLSRSHSIEARKLVPSDAWSLLSRLDLVKAWDARERGDMAVAAAVGSRLHREARRLGDVAMELQVHNLLPTSVMQDGCSAAEREVAIARTGMRGMGSGWPGQ
ncbi:winged helix-turn-helix domain-containing protein [Lysobacter capsici]|uniref:winged helix-turn-helix domain-containing protein n=1 Tax=Lysobacter capsici TaxID=435897 RepID=UPI00287B9923|nr:winged helix-turn-helix domain-containing protein [Lysobacter capsici]WND80455.1 winged helix-turn-helix domain-containing protein [Lysobacter capsici]WND85652.1 winged helix-turn-helix domain-containing protein [Lysobacter capsici]